MLFTKEKYDHLAYSKAQGKKENSKHQEVRDHEPIGKFFWHSIKLSILAEDGLHDYKINISNSKIQAFKAELGHF